jgi:S-adenosylmethionine decarboxylase
MSHFGDHIIIDLYGCNSRSLIDKKVISNCIFDIVKACKMELMSVPVVYDAVPISEKDKGGVTAFAVITESHISMHTFPFRSYNSIDVYTCRNDLDHKRVIDIVERSFKPKNKQVWVVKRGIDFPDKDTI